MKNILNEKFSFTELFTGKKYAEGGTMASGGVKKAIYIISNYEHLGSEVQSTISVFSEPAFISFLKSEYGYDEEMISKITNLQVPNFLGGVVFHPSDEEGYEKLANDVEYIQKDYLMEQGGSMEKGGKRGGYEEGGEVNYMDEEQLKQKLRDLGLKIETDEDFDKINIIDFGYEWVKGKGYKSFIISENELKIIEEGCDAIKSHLFYNKERYEEYGDKMEGTNEYWQLVDETIRMYNKFGGYRYDRIFYKKENEIEIPKDELDIIKENTPKQWYGDKYGDDYKEYLKQREEWLLAVNSGIRIEPYYLVNIYDKSREYGGDEEGGWHYDNLSFDSSEEYGTYVEAVNRINQFKKPEGGMYRPYQVAMIELVKAQSQTRITPHYE